MTEFRLPSLGADMDEATVLEWKVAPGDALVPGEVIVVIDTEKSEMDVEAIHPGTMTEILVPEGETVPVGTVLAHYDPPGTKPAAETVPAAPRPEPVPEPVSEPAATTPVAEPAATTPAPPPVAAPPPAPAPTPPGRRPVPPPLHRPVAARGVAASPKARRLAAERGVTLAELSGSGPDGAVLARDVVHAPTSAAPTAAPAATDRAGSLRQAIAGLMARSKREIPHYYLDEEIDLGPALEQLRRLNEARPLPDRIVPAALLLRATVLVAGETPELNGHLGDDGYTSAGATVNLGTAISLRGGGLVAPAIIGAERLDLDGLMAALKDLVARARAGRLKPAELAEATITVTNLGDQGVRTVHPVIVPPQVAMVGFGRISDRPVVIDGAVRVSPGVTASLAADHRVSDGMGGARFLNRLARALTEPDALFTPGGGSP
jgi:pyruvate dehydrogenase E2 component (dihydrolipoamide acetyltransferase)